MDPLQEAQRRGHLEVDVNQPGAGDLVRSWRVHCRRQGQPCLAVGWQGEQAHIELTLAPGHQFLDFVAEELDAHPELGGEPRQGGMSWSDRNLSFQVSRPSLPAALKVLRQLLESHSSPERRRAFQQPRRPKPDLSHHSVISCRVASSITPAPNIRRRLEDREYQVLSCVLAHLFGHHPTPLRLLNQASEPHELVCPGDTLPQRFPDQPPELLECWRDNLGPYLFEDRFQLPTGVLLTSEWPGILLTRPGFDRSGRRALAYAANHHEDPAYRFDGLVLLQREALGWQVMEVSPDEEGRRTCFEGYPALSLHREWQVEKWWRFTGAVFDDLEEGFFDPEEWQAGHRLFQELAQGRGPQELCQREVIPMLNGAAISLRQLLMLAQDRGEILFDNQSSAVSEALRRQGRPVVHWSADSPAWLGRLLSHLTDRYPCLHATAIWECPCLVEGDDDLLAALVRIVARAGLPQVGVRPARFQDFTRSFLIQASPGSLVRVGDPGDLSSPGTLLISADRLERCTARNFQGQRSLFELMGELLSWGDPSGRWTEPIWHACGLEIYQ